MRANLIPGQENLTVIGNEVMVTLLVRQKFIGISEKTRFDEKTINDINKNCMGGMLILGYGIITKVNKKSDTVEIEMTKKNKIKKELFN